MRASDIKAVLRLAIESGNHKPIFLWGPPGVGKSQIIREIADEKKIGLVDLRMALLDPTDLRGIPIPKDNQAFWLPPTFLPNIARDGERGIFLLDELNAAPPLVQASGFQLVLDRRVGEYTLPPLWMIVAAGNRLGDRGITHRVPSPLINRFTHLE